MSEQLPDRILAIDDSSAEVDCNRCLKSLITHSLDGSGTPVEIVALADSVEPSFSKKTSAGPEILAMVCRVENCFEVSFLYRSERQTTPAPATARDAQFPLCVIE